MAEAQVKIAERRRFDRILLQFPVEYFVKDLGPLPIEGAGETWDLSRSGVGIYLDERFPQGTVLDLRLSPPGVISPLELRGRVVWVGDRDEARWPTGIHLTDVLKDDGGIVSACLIRQFGL